MIKFSCACIFAELKNQFVHIQIIIMDVKQITSQVSNQNKLLVLIYGPPASGKSYISQRLFNEIQTIMDPTTQTHLISVDSIEQFIRNHTINQLSQLFDSQTKQWSKILRKQYKLKKGKFIEDNWKQSRQFVLANIKQIINMSSIVLIEDQMLLKSQRKKFRQMASELRVKYVEVCLQMNLQSCLLNNKVRNQNLSLQECISEAVLVESFHKFEIQQRNFIIHVNLTNRDKIIFQDLIKQAKIIEICKEIIVQTETNIENIAKNQAQVQIRKTINNILMSKQLQFEYFGDLPRNQVGRILSKIKKQYNHKVKSGTGFLKYLGQTLKKDLQQKM